MKKLVIWVALCAIPAIPLCAQDFPRAEIYGGYQLLLDDDYFLTNTDPQLNGFAAAAEINIARFFGIATELGYGKSTFNVLDKSYDRSHISLLVGPRFSRRAQRARYFGHILIGLCYEASDNTLASPPRISTNNFAFAVGGGMDLPLGNRIAIRPFQLDVVSTKHERASGFEHKLYQMRYTGGIVIKLGSVHRQ
jgi:hypothetical protein